MTWAPRITRHTVRPVATGGWVARAHATAHHRPPRGMTVAVTGATGNVGTALLRRLTDAPGWPRCADCPAAGRRRSRRTTGCAGPRRPRHARQRGDARRVPRRRRCGRPPGLGDPARPAARAAADGERRGHPAGGAAAGAAGVATWSTCPRSAPTRRRPSASGSPRTGRPPASRPRSTAGTSPTPSRVRETRHGAAADATVVRPTLVLQPDAASEIGRYFLGPLLYPAAGRSPAPWPGAAAARCPVAARGLRARRRRRRRDRADPRPPRAGPVQPDRPAGWMPAGWPGPSACSGCPCPRSGRAGLPGAFLTRVVPIEPAGSTSASGCRRWTRPGRGTVLDWRAGSTAATRCSREFVAALGTGEGAPGTRCSAPPRTVRRQPPAAAEQRPRHRVAGVEQLLEAPSSGRLLRQRRDLPPKGAGRCEQGRPARSSLRNDAVTPSVRASTSSSREASTARAAAVQLEQRAPGGEVRQGVTTTHSDLRVVEAGQSSRTARFRYRLQCWGASGRSRRSAGTGRRTTRASCKPLPGHPQYPLEQLRPRPVGQERDVRVGRHPGPQLLGRQEFHPREHACGAGAGRPSTSTTSGRCRGAFLRAAAGAVGQSLPLRPATAPQEAPYSSPPEPPVRGAARGGPRPLPTGAGTSATGRREDSIDAAGRAVAGREPGSRASTAGMYLAPGRRASPGPARSRRPAAPVKQGAGELACADPEIDDDVRRRREQPVDGVVRVARR